MWLGFDLNVRFRFRFFFIDYQRETFSRGVSGFHSRFGVLPMLFTHLLLGERERERESGKEGEMTEGGMGEREGGSQGKRAGGRRRKRESLGK